MDLITCIYLHYTSLDRSQVLQLLHVATVCYTVGGGLHARLTPDAAKWTMPWSLSWISHKLKMTLSLYVRAQNCTQIIYLLFCSVKSVRHVFCNRVANIWNSLPSDTTDFSSLLKFRRSVSNEYLAQHCKLNFTWITLLSISLLLIVFTYV